MVSSKIKERLRKLREKYGLGEYRKKGKTRTKISRKTLVIRKKKRSHGGVNMARKKRFSHKRGSMGGIGSLLKAGILGIGTASLSSYVPVQVPYKQEVAGAIGGYALGGKNIKSAGAGALAVFLTKAMSSGVTSSSTVVLN
jgi:hypothetical protein